MDRKELHYPEVALAVALVCSLAWGCSDTFPRGTACSVVEQNCAVAGLSCIPDDPLGSTTNGRCFRPGARPIGTTCTNNSDCAVGLVCLRSNASAPSVCSPYCDLSIAGDSGVSTGDAGVGGCPEGSVCRSFLDAGLALGVCIRSVR